MVHEVAEKRKTLLAWGAAAIAAVDARVCVVRALTGMAFAPCAVLALGKAALPMAHGAQAVLGERVLTGLVIAPEVNEALPGNWMLRQGSHPVPDERSLEAGEAIMDWFGALPRGAPLLVLLSGGASALAEKPVAGLSLENLQHLNRWLLGSGLDIRAMNAIRARFSQLKRGGLLRLAGDREVRGLCVSDVPGNRSEDIGSGPLSPLPVDWPVGLPEWLSALHRALPLPSSIPPASEAGMQLLADNRLALDAAAQRIRAEGWPIVTRKTLSGDAVAAGRKIAGALLKGSAGVYLFGGETTVQLPETPGKGGRNQHLALAAAAMLQGQGKVLLLALATDGVDGNTGDSGALVDGRTVTRMRALGFDPLEMLKAANSNAALAASGDLIHAGPSGTNVADIVIGWKWT